MGTEEGSSLKPKVSSELNKYCVDVTVGDSNAATMSSSDGGTLGMYFS